MSNVLEAGRAPEKFGFVGLLVLLLISMWLGARREVRTAPRPRSASGRPSSSRSRPTRQPSPRSCLRPRSCRGCLATIPRATGVSARCGSRPYTRISTDETNQPYSLGAQADRLDAFVASQPDWQIVARYTDQASGKSLDRPALVASRGRRPRPGAFDLLLVYRVDRLSRNLGQLVGLIEELAGHDVGFRSATEPFDTALPAAACSSSSWARSPSSSGRR